ncbi:Protein FAM234B [Nymphon striatum]|nr:Protein FAM234B [Nymphon striatum]
MGSLKMKNVHRFDFSNLNNDTIGHGDEDDELSDDEVFYHDSHGNHCSEENGVHKPLMAPRHKSNLKEASKLHTRIRRVPSIRILKTPIGYFCLILAAIAGIISLILYLVNGFTFFTKQHSVMQTISFIPCSNVKVEDVWTHTFPMLGTESAFRLVDVNNDDTYDIIFGFSTGVASYHYPKITCDIYFDGIKECGGGVLALDGYTGKEIWRHYTENEIFALNCNADLDGDGTKDCIAAGRIATLVAISGQNGTRLWTFNDPEVKIERSNIYTPQYIHDVDGDGVGDLLVMHGGDPLKKPGSDRNLAARIIIMSSRTGKVIKWVKVPDGFESYYSPQLITQPDGSEIVLFGTGGETHEGSLWYIHLKDLLNGHTSMSHEIYRDDHKGIMTPPALVDITKDGIADIVMAMFNSSVIAFDGITFERIWNFTFSQSESYRRMLKVKYTDHVTNKKVKELIGAENIQWAEDLARRKLKFAGHVMRRCCDTLTQLVLEGLVEGKRDIGRQRRVWGDDLKEWTKSKNLGEVKRKAENKVVWRIMVHDLRFEDVT